MTLHIGTSGFQYKEWKGSFYPEDLSLAKMLTFYSSQFSTTEINYTFRSIPSEKTISRWSEETPPGFRFSLKAPQRITHFAKLRNCGETLAAFEQAVAGLGEKLGPVLFQLPPNFQKDVALLSEFLTTIPKGLRAAFEFRHESWFEDETYEALKKGRAALCIADSDELKTPRMVTADFGYLRLRSTNYLAAEIRDWAKFLQSHKKAWPEAFVYFKHEDTGTGPKFAKMLMA